MKINKYILLILFFLIPIQMCLSQEVILLWKVGNIPNHQNSDEAEIQKYEDILRIEKVQEPSIEVYLPSKKNATGQAVLICPGGGYQILAYDWEGTDVAKWLNSIGIAAIVLKYRLPQSKSILIGHEAPLQDAQRAMRLIRFNSEKWNINMDKVGVMGFSAGGHLASTLGTHYDKAYYTKIDAIDELSAKPNFMALIYPVITMKMPYTHQGSRNSLLGQSPDMELIDFYSNELHINKNTPPTILIHATDDQSVSVENSILFYQGLKKYSVSAEMHIYPVGGHGFSLALGKGYLGSWTSRFSDWIQNFQ